MKRLITVLVLFGALRLSATQVYYSPVSVQSGQVPSSQTNFTMLINYTDNRFKDNAHGGHVASSSGFDIRPYSDAALTTALTYQTDHYDPVAGQIVMWVKIASISTSTVVYLGYGDTTLTTDGSSASTFVTPYLDIYHFIDGTTLNVDDTTGAHSGTNHGATAGAGKINGCASFASGSSQYVDMGSFAGPSAITISAWINATSFPNAYTAIAGRNDGSGQGAIIFVKSNGKLAMYCFGTSSSNYDGTGSTLSTGTWYHVVLCYDSTNGLKGYLNGSLDGSAAQQGALQTTAKNFYVGADPGFANRFFNGLIDEVRISNTARSADWVTTQYNNESAPSTFATLGTEVNRTSQTWFMFFP